MHVFDVATGKEAEGRRPASRRRGRRQLPRLEGRRQRLLLHARRHTRRTRRRTATTSTSTSTSSAIRSRRTRSPSERTGPSIAQWEVVARRGRQDDRRAHGVRRRRRVGPMDPRTVGQVGPGRDEGRRREADGRRARTGRSTSCRRRARRSGRLLRTTLVAPSLAKADVILPGRTTRSSSRSCPSSRAYTWSKRSADHRAFGACRWRRERRAAPATLPTPPVSSVGDLEPLGGDDARLRGR